MTKRRTRDEIKLEILRVLSENKDGLKATTIANAVGINFVPGKELLQGMETNDRTVIRGTDKLYMIRESGRIALKKATMENKDIMRIIELAKEITNTTPETREFEHANYRGENNKICIYCKRVSPTHAGNCAWNELRRLVNQ